MLLLCETVFFLFTHMIGIHEIFEDNWHSPLTFGLLSDNCQVLYEDLLEKFDSFGQFDLQSVLCDWVLKISCFLRECYFQFNKARHPTTTCVIWGWKLWKRWRIMTWGSTTGCSQRFPLFLKTMSCTLGSSCALISPLQPGWFAAHIDNIWIGSLSYDLLFPVLMKLHRSTYIAGWLQSEGFCLGFKMDGLMYHLSGT